MITTLRTKDGTPLTKAKSKILYKILSGEKFNQIFDGIIFLKMISSQKSSMNNFVYKIGLNEDINPLSENDRGLGLYFMDISFYPRYAGWNSYMCTVTIPNDASVITYSHCF